MFLPGIGGHLKVSHMDPRVSFGNESTNLSVQKSFFPFYIKSSHPTYHCNVHKIWPQDFLRRFGRTNPVEPSPTGRHSLGIVLYHFRRDKREAYTEQLIASGGEIAQSWMQLPEKIGAVVFYSPSSRCDLSSGLKSTIAWISSGV